MRSRLITIASMTAVSIAIASASFAHCDSLDGPVVEDARRAIAAKDITPVLKWISPEDQAEVATVFRTILDIREQGVDVQKVADTHFFETLVRVHRKSEGEGFTGLKPAGSAETPIVAADKALADGSVDELAAQIATAVRAGVVTRFQDAHEKSKHADESVEEGREFVDAYVQFTHFVEAIHELVSHGADHKHPDMDSK